jgi:chromosomal replication initiation ATPase DnaA
MRSLQQRVTRGVNARQRVWGPLWQGRFKVKIIDSQQMGPEWRTEVDFDTFVSKVSEFLGLDEQDLRSSSRSVELVEGRELLMTLGVEHYRLKVKELAESVRKSPDGMR